MRKERKAKLSMGFWFSLVVLIENVLAIGASTVAVNLLNNVFGKWVNIDSSILVLLLSITIGLILSFSTNRLFLIPIRRLNRNMTKVAKGDFTVRINERSIMKEVNNMYANFNLMTKELGSLEIIQSDFVSNVSHEFKTPINAIEGYSMLLQGSENVSEQEKEYIEKILFNTKRLSGLVGNILLLAKLDNQSIQKKFVKFRLDEQIRQSILGQEIQWSGKQIVLDVEFDECEFFGTEDLLIHVWNNLLSNAIKFSPVGGKITMRLRAEGKKIIFRITDCGQGISEDIKKHIFDKFFQGDSTHKQEGNGLGLSLVKQITDINKGTIFVNNDESGGAEFRIEFQI